MANRDEPAGGEFFSSRFGLVLAGIGMAIGTGNIWRFPRVAGKHGGLAFLLAWLVALFLWSIPLMMAEMSMGRTARRGPVGAFRHFAGAGGTWMGAWVALVTLAIMCYYSAVTGWCLRYFLFFAGGTFADPSVTPQQVWSGFVGEGWDGSPVQTLLFQALALALACWVVSRGGAGRHRAGQQGAPAEPAGDDGGPGRPRPHPARRLGGGPLPVPLRPRRPRPGPDLGGGLLPVGLVHRRGVGPAAGLLGLRSLRLRLGPLSVLWRAVLGLFVPAAFLLLTVWWIRDGATWQQGVAWWWPLARWTPGTVLLQWALALVGLGLLNGRLVSWLERAQE